MEMPPQKKGGPVVMPGTALIGDESVSMAENDPVLNTEYANPPNSDYGEAQVAFFQSRGSLGKNTNLSLILNGIKEGEWRSKIEHLRHLDVTSQERSRYKAKLPGFMVSASTNGGQKQSDITCHSGLLQLDFDKLSPGDVEAVRNALGADPHIYAAWISPSGTGVKAIMALPPNTERHKEAFASAADYVRTRYRLDIDKACSDVGRLCFVGWDPEIIVNSECRPLMVQRGRGYVLKGVSEGACSLNSSEPEPESESCILYNKAAVPFFDEWPKLRPLYREKVADMYRDPQPGERNKVMVSITSSLTGVVSEDVTKAFALAYYDDHPSTFSGYPPEQYGYEVDFMIDACLKTFFEQLTSAEADVYRHLPAPKRSAFRICKSLSLYEGCAEAPPPLFFLSAAQLGMRTRMLDTEAWRILNELEKRGCIETVKKGMRYAKGEKAQATMYKWVLPSK